MKNTRLTFSETVARKKCPCQRWDWDTKGGTSSGDGANLFQGGNIEITSGEGGIYRSDRLGAGDVTLGGDIFRGCRYAIATTGGNINLDRSNIEAFSQNGVGANVTPDATDSVILVFFAILSGVTLLFLTVKIR